MCRYNGLLRSNDRLKFGKMFYVFDAASFSYANDNNDDDDDAL